MDADDVSSGEDSGGVGGEGDMEPLRGRRGRVGRGVAGVGAGEGMGEEAFAREADQNGAAEGVEGVEAGEQGVVFVAEFPEAEAGVEEDAG